MERALFGAPFLFVTASRKYLRRRAEFEINAKVTGLRKAGLLRMGMQGCRGEQSCK
ncbi:hypothetical protein BRAO375_600045 [Bradyrhizobium sp. ORS 375]|nr:hypothetical protein BRAO375_600045 [Bradyrhizobium sp. ORS 375]